MVAGLFTARKARDRVTHELTGAIDIVYYLPLTREWHIRTCQDKYTHFIKPSALSTGEHNSRSAANKKPSIGIGNRDEPRKAEILIHEMGHREFGVIERPSILDLTPIASMAWNLAEESLVCAMTAQNCWNIAHGIGTEDGKKCPEIWQSHKDASFYTATAFEKLALNNQASVQNGQAFATAFKSFFNMPDQAYLERYQRSILRCLPYDQEKIQNPHNFTRPFDMKEFWNHVPEEFANFAPLLSRFDTMREMIVSAALARVIDKDFVQPRCDRCGPGSVQWPMRVRASRQGGSVTIMPGALQFDPLFNQTIHAGQGALTL